MINQLLQNITRKKIGVLLFFVFITGVGVIYASRSQIALLPNVEYPAISINIKYPGASAGQLERAVTIPVEQAISSLDEVRNVISYSSEGEADINVKFALDSNMQVKFLEVRERLKRLHGKLPEDIRKIRVRKYSSRDLPAVICAFTSDKKSPEQVRAEVEETLRPALQRLEGTANVKIVGGREVKFLVNVNPGYIHAQKLSIYNISRALSLANKYKPLSEITYYNQLFPLSQRRHEASAKTIANIPVIRTKEGGLVDIDDLGDVRRGYLPYRSISRVNGYPSVAAYIYKTSQANVLGLSEKVKEALAEYKVGKVENHVVFDQAEPIKESFATLERAVILGALGATVVLFLFFREIASVFIVGLSIPISISMVLIFIYFSPYNLNIITLSGIALGVGMLVDSAVVVTENIKRIVGRNDDVKLASVIGTAQMVPPLFASMLSTVIVFLPLLFVQSRIRKMYAGFAFTVSTALFSSLIVSFFLIPVLFIFVRPKSNKSSTLVTTGFQGMLKYLTPAGWLLIVFVALGLLVSAPLIGQIGETVISGFKNRNIAVHVELEPGSTIAETRRYLSRLERNIRSKSFVQNFTSRFDKWIGNINIQLYPRSVHPITTAQAIDELRRELKPFRQEGLQIYFKQGSSAEGQRAVMELSGPSIKRLYRLGTEYVHRLKKLNFLKEIHLVMPRPRPEIRVELREGLLGEYGLSTRRVLHELRAQVGGEIAASVMEAGQEYDIIFRLKRRTVDTIKEVRNLYLTSALTGNKIPLTAVSDITQAEVGSRIQRKDGYRTAFLAGIIISDNLKDAYNRINKTIQKSQLPTGYFFDLGENYEKLIEMHSSMQWVVGITLLLIYLVLMGTLESFWQPVLIMISVPVAISGSLWMLYLRDISFSLAVYIGMIILMGMVVNGAIVMISRISDLRQSEGVVTAVYEGASERLRPILLTFGTTVIAMLPLAFTQKSGVAIGSSLALTVIAGLSFGVIFNLFFLPLIFLKVEELKKSILTRLNFDPKN